MSPYNAPAKKRVASQSPAPRDPKMQRETSPAPSAGSRPPSRAQSPGPPSGYPQGIGYDPAKPTSSDDRGNTRMELPPDAYVADIKKSSFALRGKKLNSEGSPAALQVNQYRMTKFDPNVKVYQYDVCLKAVCRAVV